MSHPVPFMKASNVIASKKGAKEVPDIEDAIDADDDEAEVAEAVDDDDEADLKKDKYIKQPKAKPKRAVKKKAVDNNGEEDGATGIVTKGRGKSKAGAKVKANK